MSHKITFWVQTQTYLEPKFEAPSFKNVEVIWVLVNAYSNLKIRNMGVKNPGNTKKGYTDFLKNHLELFFYTCFITFH